MSNDCTIIVKDKDSDNRVLGVLIIKGKSEKEFLKLFQGVKTQYHDTWTWGDVLAQMDQSFWRFEWREKISELKI